MTSDPLRDFGRAGPDGARRHSPLGGTLNLIAVAVVGYWLVVDGISGRFSAAVWILGALSLAGWVLRELTRSRRLLVVASGTMVVVGAVAVGPTNGLLIVPVISGLVVLEADRLLPVWLGAVAAVTAIVLTAGGAAAEQRSVVFLLASMAGVVLGVVLGFSRRQLSAAEDRQRQADRDQQRARILADRARAARDIHDVLAHSLGGLVIQLDAVEALLEAGRTEDAARRTAEARALAASGLAEARRTVAALRDPDEEATPLPVQESAAPVAGSHGLPALVEAHRSFGGRIDVEGDLTVSAVDARHRATVVAGCREALSNARRHAPGADVALSVHREGDVVVVVVANPVGAAGGGDGDSSGGTAAPGARGHGLVGMRERFAELGDASTLSVSRTGGVFVITMRVPRTVDLPVQVGGSGTLR